MQYSQIVIRCEKNVKKWLQLRYERSMITSRTENVSKRKGEKKMTKKLPNGTWIDRYPCLTVTEYNGYKIYKVRKYGLELYKILIDEKLNGAFGYLKDAKAEVDKLNK